MTQPLLALALAVPIAFAQAPKIEGTWAGALEIPGAGMKLRVQLNFKAEAGAYTATLDSIDQGAMGIPVSKVTFDGDLIKLEVAAVQGSYSGTIKEDQITGDWTQGGRTLPLAFTRSSGAAKAALKGDPISAADRDFLLSHLERTRKLLVDAISGLTEAQWKFKPAADRWSIAECAEHITVTEGFLLKMVSERILKIPAVEGRALMGRADDEKTLAGSIDRTNKGQAPEIIRPSGRFSTPADAVKAFEAARAQTVAYAKTTQDDLRYHASPAPGGRTMDGFQYLLLIAGHSERHKLQIDEVKADLGYPKK